MPRSALFSSTARASENSNPIAPHTRFHASARARPGFPCAPRNAPPRRGAGDGDGLLADGRTPVECRAHRVLLERRQRHAARVETVGRGAPVGTVLRLGVYLKDQKDGTGITPVGFRLPVLV